MSRHLRFLVFVLICTSSSLIAQKNSSHLVVKLVHAVKPNAHVGDTVQFVTTRKAKLPNGTDLPKGTTIQASVVGIGRLGVAITFHSATPPHKQPIPIRATASRLHRAWWESGYDSSSPSPWLDRYPTTTLQESEDGSHYLLQPESYFSYSDNFFAHGQASSSAESHSAGLPNPSSFKPLRLREIRVEQADNFTTTVFLTTTSHPVYLDSGITMTLTLH